MPFFSTIEANLTGAFGRLAEVPPIHIIRWLLKLVSIGKYMILHSIWSLLSCFFDLTIRSDSVNNGLTVFLRVLTIFPFIGSPLAHRISSLIGFLKGKFMPFMDNMIKAIEYTFQVKMINDTLMNENVKIVVTGDPFGLNYVDSAPLTTLILSNHRSIIDYIVISKLILETKEAIPDHRKFLWSLVRTKQFKLPPPMDFITWARITNFPTLRLLFNIWSKDENSIVSVSNLHSHILKNRNSAFILFPEVNIITPELVMIQQKLLKSKYEDTPSLKQVLYPRYKQLNAVIKDLACWKKIKKRHSLMEHVVDRLDKWLHDDELIEQDFVELESLLNADTEFEKVHKPVHSEKVRINEFMYHFTIVYYQPVLKRNDPSHIHEHNKPTGIREPHYQLEHITPSLWDMYKAKNGDRPIIIKIHVERCRMDPLLHMKSRHLEKWLENVWCEKEKRITVMESAVKLQ
ncbi:Mum3p Ecym_1468 [Eremothecium cymbalariae DBVPG|uniref:Phospholipid/glycerol acyltransferase domain-containing protein n=1 Tax=Eremothecium cymbalariae (strain CBS 270.75 / DBVPG 7215 / KCTC 17166 / NRRL Y-17582) TaxID=931890 RepID=G8JMH7_ERECY|nr:hypothetical protein Ecym_1468 [Eremothecium cymbalariae DBVPG\